jgi:hypothetical protein
MYYNSQQFQSQQFMYGQQNYQYVNNINSAPTYSSAQQIQSINLTISPSKQTHIQEVEVSIKP